MDLREYFMDEIWPLLDDEQKQTIFEFAQFLAQYAPPPETDSKR